MLRYIGTIAITDWLDMALRYNRGDEDYIYSEYSALVKSLQSLRRQLGNASLSEQDRALF